RHQGRAGRGGAGAARAGHTGIAVHHRGPCARGHGLDRHRRLSPGRTRLRRAAAQRGRGDASQAAGAGAGRATGREQGGRQQGMSAKFTYTVPVEETQWRLPATGEVAFTWDYDTRSTELLQLYSKGKQQQWDAESRIDWSLDVDPDDPMQMDDQVVPLYGTGLWKKFSERQRSDIRYHSQVFNLSQFLHGE